MAYCRNCGAPIDDKAVICPHCGVMQSNIQDTGSIGWGVLGFFFPIVGLILYLVWRDTKPRTGRMAGKGALISMILSVVCSILLIVLSSCAALLVGPIF